MSVAYSAINIQENVLWENIWDRRGRDRMVVEFTTICAISAYHH
jgi:hypothetical protein